MRPSTSPAGTNSRRTMGLLVAGAFFLVLGGVIMLVALDSKPRGADAAQPPVVDIGAAPDAGPQGADPSAIQQSGAARLQFVDKSDPNRVASELAYEKLDPVGPGYYTLTQPRAWVYMRDGRIMHIRADHGRVKMPSRTQQPESGEFRGQVLVKVFPPQIAGQDGVIKPIDPEKDTPAILAVTDSVSFDSVLLELSTQDKVTVSSKTVLFEGEGLLVRANQVKERIELLRTKGRYVRFNPTIKDEKPAATPRPATTEVAAKPDAAAKPDGGRSILLPPAATATAAAPAPVSNPKEQLYKLTLADNLTVSQTTRTLSADTLEIFARLIDNQLPLNAFGKWAVGKTSKPEAKSDARPIDGAVAATDKPADKPVAAAAVPAAPSTFKGLDKSIPSLFISAGDEQDIVLRWFGPLVLVPMPEASAPVELAGGNHFTARFSADKSGGETKITMADTATNTRGECAQIEYAATTRTVQLLSGPAAPKVVFDAPDSGLFSVQSAKINLGTGVASIPGGGRMTSIRSGKTTLLGDDKTAAKPTTAAPPSPLAADALREIAWTDQADFQFRVIDGKIVNALDWAKFGGTVLARDRSSSMSGDSIHADFMAVGKQPTALKHLKVDGHAIAIGGPRTIDPARPMPALDPHLSSDRLEIAFQPSKVDPNDVDPYYVLATGAVKAADKNASVRAEKLEARMARDPSNNSIAVTDVVAVKDVFFERTDGIMARADDIRARPVLRTAVLTGQKVTIGRGASRITGTQVDLDDASGIMRVYGAGAFDHTQTESTQPAIGSEAAIATPDSTYINATWTKSMVFDNLRGTVDCDGDTRVTASSALQLQFLHSERLRLQLTPGSASDVKPAPASSTPGSVALGDDRRLLKATAIGASEEKLGAAHATVETRRFASPAKEGEDRILEQVFYVEGPTIIADDLRGTVTVPTAGRAVVRDQRAANTQAAIAASSGLPMGAGGPKGTSKFTWGESMEFTRATGVLTMKKDVELVHLPIGSQQVTRLVAMQLDAKFNVQESAIGAARSAELVRADATGAVYAESGQQRLLCDSFGYDALRGTAEASAATGNRVTLYDDRKGSQLVARKLFWDLVKDRVEIMEPAPITAPR